jgi:hypothetical protein
MDDLCIPHPTCHLFTLPLTPSVLPGQIPKDLGNWLIPGRLVHRHWLDDELRPN